MAKLICYTRGEVVPGAQLTDLAGEWVELVSLRPPVEEGDPGSVEIRYPWGQVRRVDPSYVSCYITED